MEFRLGTIPIRVRAQFLFMALLLGLAEHDPMKLAIWVTLVAISVTIHELGHALVGKAFGLAPSIELHGMGGHTIFGEARAHVGTLKSIAISLAGPFAGFLFAGVLIAVRVAGFHPSHPLAQHALSLFFFINIGWGVFNLLPMLPLDGGNVMRSILGGIVRERGDKIARVVSIVVAVGLGALAVRGSQWWILYLAVLYAFQNWKALGQAGQIRIDQSLAEAIEKGYAALDRKDNKEAIALLAPALGTDASGELRQVGLRIYVVALLRDGQWPGAMEVIERERNVIGNEDLSRYAQAMREIGRSEDAERIDGFVKAPAPLSEFRA